MKVNLGKSKRKKSNPIKEHCPMCPANRKPPRRTVFLLTFREIDENSRGSEFDKKEPGETEVSPFLRRRSGGATA